MVRRHPRPLLGAGAAVVLLSVLQACSEPAETATRPDALRLTFDDLDTGAVENAGTAELTVETAGAPLSTETGPDGTPAARFPAYAVEPHPAIVVVSSEEDPDALSPGSGDFSFGAQFRLDARSEGGAQDNGNNLMQRGLFDDPSQFKLQAEHGRVSCRIATPQGTALVSADGAVEAEQWYAVTCSRSGDTVSLTVTTADGERQLASEEVEVSLGDVEMSPGSLLTLGGKVDASGTPVLAGDQFNGALDNVFFRVGS